ncbi:hypothetical protein FQA39_LY02557 [Lamprigera yunnana]|nr:hypothetical protein FQA39_LY02557 [Lamprigera yunnana]
MSKAAIFVFCCINSVINVTYGAITLFPQEMLLTQNSFQNFTIGVTDFNKSNVVLNFLVHSDIITVTPSSITLEPNSKNYSVVLKSLDVGHSEVYTTSSDTKIKVDHLYIVVDIYKSETIDVVSQVVGWIYSITWALSYYPQIYENFKRKSVVGLSFDYLSLNIVGYVSFGIFINSVYFSSAIQKEYFEKNPRGLLPVKTNDVIYNLHGLFAVLVTILQCFVYEKGNQGISILARIILSLFGLYFVVLFILRSVDVLQWLDFLYYSSYLKLVITVLKYIPQAYMNYKRKSTKGWSIGVVILNLVGGICSIGQMMFDSFNYDDWMSIFGNPTKFGLGLFTTLFQVLFIFQHYVLYKNNLANVKP